jgi:hypothetical protein
MLEPKVDLSKLTNRELTLLCLEKLSELDKHFTNHLHRHWAVLMLALGAALTGTGSLVVGLILLLVKGVLKVG